MSQPASPLWTIESILRWAADDFRARGVDSPRLDAELLLSTALGVARIQLFVDAKRPLEGDELARMRGMVKRRRAREPIAYILGEREFYGRPFRVDARVLVPRPDTETLVEVALERTRRVSMAMRALDVCTGSGCVAISLGRERPTSTVFATDISDGALAVARENILRLGAYNVALFKGDLFEAVDPGMRFDLITSNPPYIASEEIPTLAPEVRDHEPRLALEGGEDGLVLLRRVVAEAPVHLVRGGVLAVEVGAGEAPDVVVLFEKAGFRDVETKRDYGRIERVVSGMLGPPERSLAGMYFAVSFALSTVPLGFIYLWLVQAFPKLRARRWLVAVCLAALPISQYVIHGVVVRWHTGGGIQTALAVTDIALGFAALPIAALSLSMWLLDRRERKAAAKLAPTTAPPVMTTPPTSMSRRQVIEAVSGASFLAASGSMLGWGAIRGRHAFVLRELPVRIAGLPRMLDGYVIAQISDIHSGLNVGERMLNEGLDRVREAKADLLIVTGDVVDSDASYAPIAARKIMDHAPKDGVFACLGNHDHYAGASRVREHLREAGIRLLYNEGLMVRPTDGGGFALLGVDDLWGKHRRGGGPNLDAALAQVPDSAPHILLSHQPWSVDAWPSRVALQLSGHTHGGQINPGFRPADIIMEYVAGEYRVGGTVLYVNSGFGTVGPPSRVNAPPEVTRIVLVAA